MIRVKPYIQEPAYHPGRKERGGSFLFEMQIVPVCVSEGPKQWGEFRLLKSNHFFQIVVDTE